LNSSLACSAFRLILFFLFLFPSFTFAQAAFENLNREYLFGIEAKYISSEEQVHTNCKPFLKSELNLEIDTLNLPSRAFCKRMFIYGSPKADINRSNILVAPLITLLGGYEFEENNALLETRLGAKVNANYKSKLALELQVLNNNLTSTADWSSYSQNKRVLPGNGYAYTSNLGFTNLQWNGYVSFSQNSYFNFAAGRGKHFFGDGYRSLLLSDVSTAYDFLKITTKIWKIKYINLFTNLKDIRNSAGINSRFKNKYATFHYLSWNATKRINISFFESIIWQSRDSNNRNLGYDVNYLNPVIFYRPTEYALGSSDNSLIGASFRIKLFKKQFVYGQLLLDEFLLKEVRAQNGWWANKQGFQLGIKSFDVAKIKNLFMQLEWNYVRPYTYAHSNPLQNYGHFNESLAHPLGANFWEFFATANYQKNRTMFDFKVTYAQIGLDSATKNFGQDIYASNLTRVQEYNNLTTQGLKTELATLQITCSYLFNRANNLRIELGLAERYLKNAFQKNTSTYLVFGVKTALFTAYSDY
jgi:hypothetical protein